MQLWPAKEKALAASFVAASSRSASAATTTGVEFPVSGALHLGGVVLTYQRLIVLAAVIVVTVGLALVVAYVAWLWPSLPTIEDLRGVQVPQPSVLLAADGSTLATFRQARQQKLALKHLHVPRIQSEPPSLQLFLKYIEETELQHYMKECSAKYSKGSSATGLP